MPIPKRNPGESHDDFMERCMSDETMKNEYPDADQRTAVCSRQSEKRASYSAPSTSMLYAMYEPAMESFYEASAEVRATARDMSSDEMRAAVDDLYAAADINYAPEDAEDFESLYTVKDGVASIPVRGMLVNTVNPCAAFFGESATEYGFIQAAIERANSDPMVREIALDIDSPGGEVTGVDQTAGMVAQSEKRIVALVGGMAASAAYWIASQADQVIAMEKTSLVGSIGVAAEIRDYSERDKKNGIKRHVLTSTGAPNKRPDINTEEGRAQVVDRLDDTHAVFVERVAAGRGVPTDYVSERFGKGGVLIAEKALAAGMIDDIAMAAKYDKNKKKDNASLAQDEPNTQEAEMADEKQTGQNAGEQNATQTDKPEAKAEAASVDAVARERQRVSALLKLGAKPEDIEAGISVEQFAVAELTQQRAKREEAPKKDFGTFNPEPATPKDTAPQAQTESDKKFKAIDDLVDQFPIVKKEDK
jgi:signal peptide peptidase SppA